MVANVINTILKDLKAKVEEFSIKEEYLKKKFEETNEREYKLALSKATKLKDAFSFLVQYETDTKGIWDEESFQEEVATAYRSYAGDIELLEKYTVEEIKSEEKTVVESTTQEHLKDDSAMKEHLKGVNAKLQALRDKATYFDEKYNKTKEVKYIEAKEAADKLILNLQNAVDAYEKNLNLDSFKKNVKNVFTDTCAKEIKVLETHRGWKQAVVNTLAFILSFGVGYLAAAAYTGRWAVFQPATDSAEKILGFDKKVDELKELPKENEDDNSSYSGYGAYGAYSNVN